MGMNINVIRHEEGERRTQTALAGIGVKKIITFSSPPIHTGKKEKIVGLKNAVD
jgi:hypothetical protein